MIVINDLFYREIYGSPVNVFSGSCKLTASLYLPSVCNVFPIYNAVLLGQLYVVPKVTEMTSFS